jgi:hypothetical protein
MRAENRYTLFLIPLWGAALRATLAGAPPVATA